MMATKRATLVKSTTKRKAAPPGIDADTRRRLIAAEAYFLAERRGFAAGNELADWVAAEAAVDSRLRQLQVA
jgi:hypothetical protein